MSMEIELKRRSPSVIARLMDLDRLPLQQSSRRYQQRVSPESHSAKKSSVDYYRKRGIAYGQRSSRRSSKDEQQFKDVFEVLDSNQDLLLKYFEQPDTLLAKHLNDLHVSTFRSHCAHSEFVQTYDAHNHKYENIDMERKCGRSKMRLNYRKSHHQSDLHGRYAVCSAKAAYFRSRGTEQSAATPTKIVVLKPNLGKVKDAVKIVASPCNSHDIIFDHSNHTDFSITRAEKAGTQEKKNCPNIHISRRRFKESREIASEVTEKMKSSLNGNGSEMRRTKLSNSHSSLESYIRKEATKRLLERWKWAHKSKDDEISGRGKTLAEMLAIPDKKTLTPKFDSVLGGETIYSKISIGDEPSRCVEPLGMSSRDGWKDGCICNLSSAKFLPPSALTLGKTTTSLFRKPFPGHNHMISSDDSKAEMTKPKKGRDPKYGLWRHSKSGCRKSRCHRPTTAVSYESSTNMHTDKNEVKNSFGGSCLTDQDQDIVADKLALSLKASIPAPADSGENLELGNGGDCYEHETKLSPEISSSVTAQVEPQTSEKSIFAQQERLVRSSNECSTSSQSTVPGLESPSSIKDVDQPSPVSVLETSLTGDVSSGSDCFENLSAKLRGLRMQLQLLKFDSESHAEGSVLVSSDEYGEEGSTRSSDESRSHGIEDSWESSYIVDILTYAGLGDDVHLDNSFVEWQSPDYSVNPLLFYELEKKYFNVTSCLRSERRLLFDHVISGLHDIHHQFMEPRPGVRPATKLPPTFITHVGKGCLPLILANKERNGNKDTLGKALARETEWLDLKDGIRVIGLEMEKLLINELIADAELFES